MNPSETSVISVRNVAVTSESIRDPAKKIGTTPWIPKTKTTIVLKYKYIQYCIKNEKSNKNN